MQEEDGKNEFFPVSSNGFLTLRRGFRCLLKNGGKTF